MKYLQRTTSGAVGNGQAQRSSTRDAQRAAPRATAWAPRSSTCDAQRAAPRATACAPRSSTCPAPQASAWAPRLSTSDAQRAPPRTTAWAPRSIPRAPKRGRGQQLDQDPHRQKLGTNSDFPPCSIAAFVVNSEPHTRTRPFGPFICGALAGSLCSYLEVLGGKKLGQRPLQEGCA
jgi:hypothetical protein